MNGKLIANCTKVIVLICCVSAPVVALLLSSSEVLAEDCPAKGCNCKVLTGLKGFLHLYSALELPNEEKCLEVCVDTSAHVDRQNISTECEWREKQIFRNSIGLLDVNYADCKIGQEIRRTSHRVCLHECANRLKETVKSDPTITTVDCTWDEAKIPASALQAQGGKR